MKIIYKLGNLVTAPETLLLHGANAQGVMGSGVAKAIRKAYPLAYSEYRKTYELDGLSLGDVIFVKSGDKIIANGITQENYGRNGKQYVDYKAINMVVQKVNLYCADHDIDQVAMPLIGAGLGGGKWSIISKIIEDGFTYAIPSIYLIDRNIPN